MKKYVFGLLMTTVMLLSLAAPLVSTVAADEADWYMTVDGVLDSDYYWLYPYDLESFSVGFSKFGELINSDDNVGLEYAGAVDPFAFPAGSDVSPTVPKRMWVQGWYVNITYDHRTVGPRNVWAGALHSDAVLYGNDWIRVDFMNDQSLVYGEEDFRDPGYFIGGVPYAADLVQGGRKTNGTAVTDPIEVLYDGPREFIAICRTTIYDHLIFHDDSTESDVALLQIAITIRFNKVKKCVVLYKDVKSLLVEKEGIKMKIQFSNRGEVDLGTDSVSSYAHFYTEGTMGGESEDDYAEGLPTVYDADWTLVTTENPYDTEYPGYSAAGPFPQSSGATIDVAQAIHPGVAGFFGTPGYVWSAGFWPSLSDWSIDGWDQWWRSMTVLDPHYIDYRNPSEEPTIPFYIGEWDFVLYHTLDASMRTQFRGVTQYAVTTLNDGSDANMFMGSNVIDSEIMYYLDETFNPWDLVDAVHKDTERWVEFPSNDFTTNWRPFLLVSNSEWDDYCTFAERVIDLETGELLTRGPGGYSVSVDADGYGVFDLPGSGDYKVLYSTLPQFELADIPAFVYTNSLNMSADDVLTIAAGDWSAFEATDLLGCDHDIWVDDLRLNITLLSDAADFTAAWNPDTGVGLEGWLEDFEVDIERTFYGSWDFMLDMDGPVLGPVVFDDGAPEFPVDLVSMVIDELDVHWTIEPPIAKSIIVDTLQFEVVIGVDMTYNTTEQEMNVTCTVDLNTAETMPPDVMYSAWERGRYEWVEVGRDAASVDSAGAALVAEAFDSYKKIGIGIAGADMEDPVSSNMMPQVMAKFGDGTSVADYKDSILRAALRDDWCTYWPVASSNMIGVGGPLANLLAYYANDFTDAFYGLPEFSGAAYMNAIAPISCWNRNWDGAGYNTYADYSFFGMYIGYAVISTYKDINGTVLYNVWGNEGRDTYYASLWLHGDEAREFTPGIEEMQRFPKGVTSIVLGIMYGSDWEHPTYFIPEMLGTISETSMSAFGETDGMSFYYSEKGGIHDP
jgi:hypothetical protein